MGFATFKTTASEYWSNAEGLIDDFLSKIHLPTDFGVDPKKKHLGMIHSEVLMKMVRDTGFEPVTPCV